MKKLKKDFILVCERHPELEKCRQLAAFKYLERKSQLPNEALIGIVLFSARWYNFERLPQEWVGSQTTLRIPSDFGGLLELYQRVEMLNKR